MELAQDEAPKLRKLPVSIVLRYVHDTMVSYPSRFRAKVSDGSANGNFYFSYTQHIENTGSPAGGGM